MESQNVSATTSGKQEDVKKAPTNIYIMRHGERVDFLFGNDWIPRFFDGGKYVRRDLNLPITLPQRNGYPNTFDADTPLTNVGEFEARLTGSALGAAGTNVRHVFCSPALRCVQTCHNVLTALGVADKLPIKIEPGLFEWLTWYIEKFPNFMTLDELQQAGFNIDKSYNVIFSVDYLKANKTETLQDYYDRSDNVIRKILDSVKDQGGDILLLAHGCSHDACSRNLTGKEPRDAKSMRRLAGQVPFCSLAKLSQIDSKWQLVESNVPGLSHSMNQQFDWRVLLVD